MNLADLALMRGALQKPGELDRLVELIQAGKSPRVVLEVGTAAGGTLWLWCQLAKPSALIISVDLPGGDFGGGYPEENIPYLRKYAMYKQKIELLRCDSHNPETLEKVKEILGEKEVDLLFIDGDHTYEGVKQDWEMYSPLLSRNGIGVFHDIVPHKEIPECQVDKFWKEVRREYTFSEIHDSVGGDWAGIGVIHRD